VGCSVKAENFQLESCELAGGPSLPLTSPGDGFRLAQDNSICTSEDAVVKLGKSILISVDVRYRSAGNSDSQFRYTTEGALSLDNQYDS